LLDLKDFFSVFSVVKFCLRPAFTIETIACSCEDAAINECRVAYDDIIVVIFFRCQPNLVRSSVVFWGIGSIVIYSSLTICFLNVI